MPEKAVNFLAGQTNPRRKLSARKTRNPRETVQFTHRRRNKPKVHDVNI